MRKVGATSLKTAVLGAALEVAIAGESIDGSALDEIDAGIVKVAGPAWRHVDGDFFALLDIAFHLRVIQKVFTVPLPHDDPPTVLPRLRSLVHTLLVLHIRRVVL